jgi:chemotaxis signal transduction protein
MADTEKEKFELPRPEGRPLQEDVDWSALFDAMADMVEDEKVADVLTDRARALARVEEDATAEAGDAYTLFSLGAERYALSATAAREVLELPKITPIPRAPAAIAGLFHRRGRILVALHTKGLLGLEENGRYGNAVVLTGEPARVALLVDEVEAARVIPSGAIYPGDVGGRAIAGITPDRCIVLDAEALRAEIRRVVGTETRGI